MYFVLLNWNATFRIIFECVCVCNGVWPKLALREYPLFFSVATWMLSFSAWLSVLVCSCRAVCVCMFSCPIKAQRKRPETPLIVIKVKESQWEYQL